MPSLNHIHTYVRRNKTQHKCIDAYCTHIIETDIIKGKVSMCSKCKVKEVLLDRQNLKRKYPICLGCSNTKIAKEFREREKLFESLIGAVEFDQKD